MNQNELQTMYGATPESFKHRVSFALKETEAKPVKHTLRTVFIATAIVLMLTAAAYAAFSSQVTELFGTMYGDDTKAWLEEGSVATTEDQSFTLGDLVYTVDEVVYRNNGLYGVGTIRAAEGSDVVIIGEDQLLSDPYGYDIHGAMGSPETAPDDAKTIAEVAQEKGGKVLLALVRVNRIGVDGGELLSLGSSGYSWAQQRDGSIRFSFEASDGVVIGEGSTYQIEMYSAFYETDADGYQIQETKQKANWLIEIQPEPISEQSKEPTADTTAPTLAIGDVKLIVPDGYSQTYTMPVYSAAVRDFGADLKPELFNQSGIAKTESYLITYNDEAQLSWSPETLFYKEYKGTYNGNYKEPKSDPMVIPLKTLSHAASDLAGDVYSGWLNEETSWEDITLNNTALSGITLDEAKAKVEAMLKALNVEGYACDYALDMDVERIRSMGETMNRLIEENQNWNPPIIDYSLVTEADEGFFLHYANGVDTGDGRFDLYAYVTSKGIVDFQLRDMYIQGDAAYTPATLVSPETVMARLAVEIADSRFSDMKLDHIISVELTYAPVRADNAADGMVFTPAWYVVYQDSDAVEDGYDCYAIFNAVDGTMIASMFQ